MTLFDKMERLKDAIILLDHDMGRDDINDTYRDIKDLVKIKYRDIQRRASRPLLKELLKAKLKEFKKTKGYNKTRKEKEKGG